MSSEAIRTIPIPESLKDRSNAGYNPYTPSYLDTALPKIERASRYLQIRGTGSTENNSDVIDDVTIGDDNILLNAVRRIRRNRLCREIVARHGILPSVNNSQAMDNPGEDPGKEISKSIKRKPLLRLRRKSMSPASLPSGESFCIQHHFARILAVLNNADRPMGTEEIVEELKKKNPEIPERNQTYASNVILELRNTILPYTGSDIIPQPTSSRGGSLVYRLSARGA